MSCSQSYSPRQPADAHLRTEAGNLNTFGSLPAARASLRRRLQSLLATLPVYSALTFLTALLPLAAGCSDASHERAATFPVEGIVLFKGQPIPGAFVVLHPRSALPNVPTPRASVSSDGALKVSTYYGGDGAPVGEYVLTVEWYRPVKHGQEQIAGPNVIPRKYASARTSDLVVSAAAKPNKLPPINL
jgi:hypothetical protein